MDGKPNIIVIFADQMRGMDIRCAGNTDIITPNMDGLAAEGTIFTHAYANTPVCTPSRGSLLTGLYPLAHEALANDLPISDRVDSIGTILKKAGYRTGYIGKWHLDGVPRDKFTSMGPRRMGFDRWAVYNCSHNYLNAAYYENTPEKIFIKGYEPEEQTDLAIKFIKNTDTSPFCLFLSWGPPHDPYEMVPDKYKTMYDAEKLSLRPNFKPVSNAKHDIGEETFQLNVNRVTLSNYYAAITALDEQLGRILDELEKSGLSDSTIVVFTSDHGDMLSSHAMLKKQQPWEESINIPFIIRWPGHIPENSVCGELLGIVDIVPSLLGLAGIRIDGLQGVDLSDAIYGNNHMSPDSVFIMNIVSVDEACRQGIGEWRGVRTKRYTYACLLGGKEWMLYDNINDPYQLINLIDDPSYSKVKEQLKDRLRKWLVKTDDEFMTGFEHVKELGLSEFWNKREMELHPDNPGLIK